VVLDLVSLALKCCNHPNRFSLFVLGAEDESPHPGGVWGMEQFRIPLGNPQFLAERRKQLEYLFNRSRER
jgi:hypothetical protein